ncbi:DUF6233 domain-containing protein [Streptomyces scabiei]|uniref:DUF6233 domain-containing protein n=1 Tax=Streptomyces scabiei TaxID=1930 RepID=UPI0004E7198E|nr:DUF6233 domain-containing protein [Streptomyces scabiei]KFG10544.1 hypothetical protein IQ61_02145 [Streptomyces scabiei]MDX2837342.1 DUF6233 domain-containing protein [Streptomyces scabiei]MDX3681888.1 DUF6233 domain-containing protein [Streptomyces scabiei]
MADTPPEPEPPPITVVLPDGQEVTGRLQERQQVPGAWLYKVAVPAWQNTPSGQVEPAWYVVWVQAPDHVKPVPGVSYDDVPTTRLPPPPAEQQILGERRPSGWVLQKLGPGRGPGRGVIHAVDCEEAPAGAPVLSLDQALDAAEHPGARLCSLCGAAAELDPMLKGFDHGFED